MYLQTYMCSAAYAVYEKVQNPFLFGNSRSLTPVKQYFIVSISGLEKANSKRNKKVLCQFCWIYCYDALTKLKNW